MPQEPQAYLNGQIVPAHQALIAASDAGFVQGTTVAEQLRTFSGRLYQLEKHVERLFHSLEIVEVDPGLSREDFIRLAEELVAINHPLIAPGDDLSLAMFVTPGPYPAMSPPGPPTVGLHTFPIRFGHWASKFQQGEALATTDVRQVPTACWPPELKCRSRMHYYLADRQAAKRFPGSRALMLDMDGFVVEATTANVVLYRQNEGLLLPPAEKILPGISQAVLLEIAAELGISAAHRDLLPADVAAADEVFLTSTSPCMLPVVRFNGQPIADGRPGPVFVACIQAWSERVGLDIIAQAQQFASR
jgi:branched-chain amino acid aminotransferase